MSKKTFIHAENNNKILSSNEVRLYVPPEPEKMKVIIWGKELCNGAEWYDFLKCVEEKTRENDKLKQQLIEKEREIEDWKQKTQTFLNRVSEQNYEIANNNLKQLAITELEKVKVKLKDRISMMKNEEYSYLQKVVTWYDICDQINNQIKELKGE